MTSFKKIPLLLLLLSLAGALFSKDPLEASPRIIRVGIQQQAHSGTIESEAGLRCTDGGGRAIPVGRRVTVSISGNTVFLDGQTAKLPLDFRGSPSVKWNGKPYRGSLQLVQGDSGVSVVNVLDLESYLRGVLKIEVNPAWPMEALKAQAIIARTYALRQSGRHGSAGFDICATTHCQAYRGMDAEDARLDRAINETRGIVVLYGSQLAQTYYFSDGAGWTADSSTVWGGAVSYLTCRQEPVPYESPHSRWRTTLNQAALQKIMSILKKPVGSVLEIRIAGRDSGNRATLLEVRGTDGRATITGHSFRMAAGSNLIRSTLFEVTTGNRGIPTTPAPLATSVATPRKPPAAAEEDPLIVLTRQGAFSSSELMDMLLHPEKREDYIRQAMAKGSNLRQIPATLPPAVPPAAPSFGGEIPPVFEFQGRGWGHGVGLSQWGAKALAENGWSFGAILGQYFPGTRLQPLY